MKKRILPGGASADALLLTVIKLVTIFMGLAVTRLLSQFLPVYDYGTYSQVMLVVSTVNTLTILGMIDGVNYFFCSEKDPQRREDYVSTIFTLQCIIGVLAGSLVMLLTQPICSHFENPDLKKLLIFSASLPLPINLLSMLQVLLVSVGKARMLAARNLIVSLVRLAVVILTVTLVKNVAVVLATTLTMDLLQLLFFCWILRKNGCPIRFGKLEKGMLRHIFSYCAPMGVFTAISALNRDCDKYLIALMTDTQTLAVYANASKVLPFDVVMNSFCTVLVPRITRLVSGGERHSAGKLYRLFLEISLLSTGILCCAALAASPQLMELLYSEKYAAGLPVFCIYILVDLLRFTNITLVLAAAGQTARLMCYSVGSLGMNVVLNYVFYCWFGVAGPALATLLTTMLLGIAILGSGSRVLDMKLRELFDGKFLLLFALESLILTMVLYGVQTRLERAGFPYFVILVLICGIYGGVMLLLHGKRLLRDLKQVNRASDT